MRAVRGAGGGPRISGEAPAGAALLAACDQAVEDPEPPDAAPALLEAPDPDPPDELDAPVLEPPDALEPLEAFDRESVR